MKIFNLVLLILIIVSLNSCTKYHRVDTPIYKDLNYTFTNPRMSGARITQLDTQFVYNRYSVPTSKEVLMYASSINHVTSMSNGEITVDTVTYFRLRIIPLDSLDYQLIDTSGLLIE